MQNRDWGGRLNDSPTQTMDGSEIISRFLSAHKHEFISLFLVSYNLEEKSFVVTSDSSVCKNTESLYKGTMIKTSLL